MDIENYTDKQLIDELEKLKKMLDNQEVQIQQGESDKSMEELRSVMSRINHLKMQAKKRNLKIN